MELKNVSLCYLWKAVAKDIKAEPTGQSDYNTLIDSLKNETKEQLLDVKFSGITFKPQARTLSKIVAAATSTFPYLPILLSGCN